MKSLILGILGSIWNVLVALVLAFLLNMVGDDYEMRDAANALKTFYFVVAGLNFLFAVLSVKWKGAAGFLTFIAVLSLMSGVGFLAAIFDFIAASACKNKFANKKQKELEAKIAALEAATAAKNNDAE